MRSPLIRASTSFDRQSSQLSCVITASLALCLCLGAVSCRRQGAEQPIGPTVPSVHQPDIRFDTDSHDFGTVFQMRSLEHVFKVKNAGTAKLIVNNVSSTCGCTATLLSAKELAPGTEAELKVELKTGMLEGETAKEIMVASNDPDEPVKKIQIKANVVRRLLIEPRMIRFGMVRKTAGAAAWLDVKPTPGDEIKSVEARSSTRDLRVSLEPVAGKQSEYRVKVSIANDVPLSHVSGWVELFVNGETTMCSQVLVSANVVGDIDMSPKHLIFRAARGKETDLGAINLTKSVTGTFKILGAESDVPQIKVEVSPVEQGKSYALIARLAPNVPQGQVRGTITVRTDDPIQPKIPINVFGIVE